MRGATPQVSGRSCHPLSRHRPDLQQRDRLQRVRRHALQQPRGEQGRLVPFTLGGVDILQPARDRSELLPVLLSLLANDDRVRPVR